MKNQQQPSMGGHAEPHKLKKYIAKDYPAVEPSEDQLLLNRLTSAGFDWEEAVKLISLREHLYENVEMREQVKDNKRMHFVRWLYEHGEMSDE